MDKKTWQSNQESYVETSDGNEDVRPVKILAIGDSHTQGAINNADETWSYSLTGLWSFMQRLWGALGAYFAEAYDQTVSAINITTGCTDPNISAFADKPSFVTRIPQFLRKCFQVGPVTVANLGIGGSTTYDWAGELASRYVHPVAQADPGDTITITADGVDYVYTFVAGPAAAANQVLIGATVAASVTNLAHAINGSGGGYGAGTVANPKVWVPSPNSTNYLQIFAKSVGTAANAFTAQGSTAARIAVVTDILVPTTDPVPFVNGSNTAALYANGRALLAAGIGFGDPDVVTITLGTNDAIRLNTAGSAPDVQTNIALLLDKIHADYPAAKVILAKPMINSTAAVDTIITTVVSPAYDAVAASRPWLTLVDLHAFGVGVAPFLILDANNGIHATPYGYDVFAQRFAWTIAEILGVR